MHGSAVNTCKKVVQASAIRTVTILLGFELIRDLGLAFAFGAPDNKEMLLKDDFHTHFRSAKSASSVCCHCHAIKRAAAVLLVFPRSTHLRAIDPKIHFFGIPKLDIIVVKLLVQM